MNDCLHEFRELLQEYDPGGEISNYEEQIAWFVFERMYDRNVRLMMYIDNLTEGTD